MDLTEPVSQERLLECWPNLTILLPRSFCISKLQSTQLRKSLNPGFEGQKNQVPEHKTEFFGAHKTQYNVKSCWSVVRITHRHWAYNYTGIQNTDLTHSIPSRIGHLSARPCRACMSQGHEGREVIQCSYLHSMGLNSYRSLGHSLPYKYLPRASWQCRVYRRTWPQELPAKWVRDP